VQHSESQKRKRCAHGVESTRFERPPPVPRLDISARHDKRPQDGAQEWEGARSGEPRFHPRVSRVRSPRGTRRRKISEAGVVGHKGGERAGGFLMCCME